jgi:uncharacterized protein YgiM (DUF1202 family)
MRTTHLLFGVTVALTVVAVAACCGKKKEDEATTADAAPAETASAPVDTPAESIDPVWKTKCPSADRPMSGTVTALKNLVVHKEAKDDSEHIGSIGPGTWVNLLGMKQNWYCIDYPCDVGKLCPGWVEERHTQRKAPEKDAGVVLDAAVAVPDAAVATDGGKVPNIRIADAGPAATTTTTTGTPPGKVPPGKRPPVAKPPK